VTVTTLLLTVVTASARCDLAVPAATPIAELLPHLADAVGWEGGPGGTAAAPALLRFGGAALPPECSLAACGIGDGAILELAAAPEGGAGAGGAGDRPDPGHPVPAGRVLPPQPRRSGLHVNVDPAPPPPPGLAMPPARERAGMVLRALRRLDPDPGAPVGLALRQRVRSAWTARGPEGRIDAAIAAVRLRRCATIGVVSASARVGKTTVVALLAASLAGARGGRTVLLDGHPGPDSLSSALAPGVGVAASDLLPVLDHPALTRQELRALLVPVASGTAAEAEAPRHHRSRLPDGEAVPRQEQEGTGTLALLPVRAPTLAQDPDLSSGHAADQPSPASQSALAQRGWVRILHGLARHATTVLLDCGPGLDDPAAQAALAAADQLVLVLTPDLGHPGPQAVESLRRQGRDVVVVILGTPPGLGAEQVAARLPGVVGVVLLPSEPQQRQGATLDWGAAPTSWRHQLRELAWLLVSDWPRLGIATSSGRNR